MSRNFLKNITGKTDKEKKSFIIGASILGLVILGVICVGIFTGVKDYKVNKEKEKAADTSAYAISAAEENAFQFSDTVVEINSLVFAVDSSKITVRKAGSNSEKTLVKGNIDAGIVTDSKTVYYYDLDTDKIMSVDVETKKKSEIVSVKENIQLDAKSSGAEYVFARFDGAYKDYVYYQVQEAEEYMPNYMVNVKNGKVTKLSLTEYGTYKFQIAGGKLYFDIFRTVSAPSVLFTANPDGSDVKVLVEGVSNFEVIDNKIYYFKAEDITKNTNKIMCMDIKTQESTLVRDNMEYVSGGFTGYGMISDKQIGQTMYTVIDYYDGRSEALGGNGVKICGEVAIVHAGVPEDISTEEALKQATVPEWYVVGKELCSQLIKLPEGSTPANFKDGYLYYLTYTEDGKSVMNRTKVKF